MCGGWAKASTEDSYGVILFSRNSWILGRFTTPSVRTPLDAAQIRTLHLQNVVATPNCACLQCHWMSTILCVGVLLISYEFTLSDSYRSERHSLFRCVVSVKDQYKDRIHFEVFQSFWLTERAPLSPVQSTTVQDYPLPAVRNWLWDTFSATSGTWGPSPPSPTYGCVSVVRWATWQRTVK